MRGAVATAVTVDGAPDVAAEGRSPGVVTVLVPRSHHPSTASATTPTHTAKTHGGIANRCFGPSATLPHSSIAPDPIPYCAMPLAVDPGAQAQRGRRVGLAPWVIPVKTRLSRSLAPRPTRSAHRSGACTGRW